MPTFEYRCSNKECVQNDIIEWYGQAESSKEVPECAMCHTPMVRLMSAPSHRYIGEGFYATEHGNQGFNKNPREKDGRKKAKDRLDRRGQRIHDRSKMDRYRAADDDRVTEAANQKYKDLGYRQGLKGKQASKLNPKVKYDDGPKADYVIAREKTEAARVAAAKKEKM